MAHDEHRQLYQAYLLRFWKEDEPRGNWRFSLEEISGQRSRQGFENLDALTRFLQAQLDAETTAGDSMDP